MRPFGHEGAGTVTDSCPPMTSRYPPVIHTGFRFPSVRRPVMTSLKRSSLPSPARERPTSQFAQKSVCCLSCIFTQKRCLRYFYPHRQHPHRRTKPMVQLQTLLFIACLTTGRLGTVSADAADNTQRHSRDGQPTALERRGDPLCHRFEPNHDRSTWSHAAALPSKRRGPGVDCTDSQWPCEAPPDKRPPERVSWPVQFRSTNVSLELDITSFDISKIGGTYAEEVSTAEDIVLYVPSRDKGYLASYARAVLVPGWFGDCGDGLAYPGEALIPDAKGVTHNVVLYG